VTLVGCGSPKVVRNTSPDASFNRVRPGLTIAVLEPMLTYEEAQTEALVDGTKYSAGEVKADLVRAASNALTTRGFKPQQVAVASPAASLTAQSVDLLRPSKSPELLQRLKEVGRELSVDAVCVQYCRVKLGPGGSWDPGTGMITSAMNSAQLRAAIVDLQSGAALWNGSFYLREVPRVGRRAYREAVDSLYQEAKTK
jgi:hypothetical protein